MSQFGIIILAAGSSSRLGQPKQLLQYQHQSLVAHTAAEALKSINTAVLVVTGSNDELVREQLKDQAATSVYNDQWQEGMASSIRKGLSEMIKQHPGVEGCIFSVCDQPFVSADLFNKLTERKLTTDKAIVACSYAGTLGVPSLFDKKYFDELSQLQGDEGAKKIIAAHNQDVEAVDFEQGVVDIDTPEDYKNLLNIPL